MSVRLEGPSASFVVLVRHFRRQLFSLESVGTGGDVKEIVAAILTLLAAPGYLLAVLATIGGPRLGQWWRVADLPPLLWFWKEEWLLLTLSMAATGVLVAAEWKSLVLDTRDYRILAVLPVRRHTVLLAKLASLAFVVVVLHAGVNALSGVVLPYALPGGYWRNLLALQTTLLVQTLFVTASVLAVQALCTRLLPPAMAQRAATLVQAGVLLAVAVLVASSDVLSERALALRDTPDRLHSFVPVAWFMALYELLLGFDTPQFRADAGLGLLVTALTLAVATAGCLLGYRDNDGRRPRAARRLQLLSARLDAALVCRHPRRPIARGVSAFVSKTLWRSASAALIARGWLIVGVAVVLAGLGGAALRDQLAGGAPVAAVVAPTIVLPFFGLVGLRLAASFPTDLPANWLFRVAETGAPGDYASAVRAAALRSVVLPVLALAVPVLALLWGPGLALAHVAVSLAIALATTEWLFLGFGKIPFTCSYLPGKANLRRTWPMVAAIAAVYCVVLPEITARALLSPFVWAGLLLLLVAAWSLLLALSRRQQRRPDPLVFDERAPSRFTELGIYD